MQDFIKNLLSGYPPQMREAHQEHKDEIQASVVKLLNNYPHVGNMGKDVALRVILADLLSRIEKLEESQDNNNTFQGSTNL